MPTVLSTPLLSRLSRLGLSSSSSSMLVRRLLSTSAPTATNGAPNMFSKILIANRGEIACRVMRTAQKMGIRTVSVFSDADRYAMHTQLADEAHHVGAAPARESYLLGDRIVEIALRTGAQAIHPGYGFLSENAGFAELCGKNGLVFIGPPPSAIRAMGSKSESKILMTNANVPCVPGYHGEDQSDERLRHEAEKIGFPVLIKAVLGGGGKGMRIVLKSGDFQEALESARREAIASFGDDRVLVERYVQRPRHVEMQVFGDTHGNYVHLFERDCSVQRRYQKVLEEAPAPGMTEEMRQKMGESATAAAAAVNYVGAGTVEFLLDAADNSYFFMEMNTRLQVEHPVTEMITGQDLVEWQLRVAAGHPLPLQQKDLAIRGHALEARIYAENPLRGYLPGTGRLTRLRAPSTTTTASASASTAQPQIRVETGVREGDEVSIFYDPMIAKLVVHGSDRAEALRRMSAALRQYQVVGCVTNIDFLDEVVRHPGFQQGSVETSFLKVHHDAIMGALGRANAEATALAAVAVIESDAAQNYQPQEGRALSSSSSPATKCDPWSVEQGFRVNTDFSRTVYFTGESSNASGNSGGDDSDASSAPSPATTVVRVVRDGRAGPATAAAARALSSPTVSSGDVFRVHQHQQQHGSKAQPSSSSSSSSPSAAAPLSFTILDRIPGSQMTVATSGGRRLVVDYVVDRSHGTATVFYDGRTYSMALPAREFTADAHDGASLTAPMPGKIVKVLVEAGQKIRKGEALVVMEAMKMEHTIRAPHDGVVKQVRYNVGDMVNDREQLATFESP